jgi:hypothetical protein
MDNLAINGARNVNRGAAFLDNPQLAGAGLHEIDAAELEGVEGGFGWYCIVGTIVIGLLLAA